MQVKNIFKKFAQTSLKIKAGFQIDEISRVVILFFSDKRVQRWKSLENQPNKGFILSGAKGVGKTLNFQILCRVIADNTSIQPLLISVKEIQSRYRLQQEQGKGEEFLQYLVNKEFLVIDDLGNEEIQMNDYGTKKNLVAEILYQRYPLFQRELVYTYATTNLLNTHLEKLYDPRLIDRMKEMFVFHIVTETESKRTNPVEYKPVEIRKEPELTPYEKRLIYLEWYKEQSQLGYCIDIKDITWQVLLKNKKVNELMLDRFDVKAEATKMCEREKMKTDITKAILVDEIDVIKASKYLLMKDIIKQIDFKTIEIL